MTLEQAFEYMLAKVEELRQRGIRIESRPNWYMTEQSERAAKTRVSITSQYRPPASLPAERWRIIKLIPANDEEVSKIREVRDHLCRMGIGFDTGGDSEGLYWEADWSFRLVEDQDDDLLDEMKMPTLP